MEITSDPYLEETVRIFEAHYPGGETEQVVLRIGDLLEFDAACVRVTLVAPPGQLRFNLGPLLWYSLRTTTIRTKATATTAKHAGQGPAGQALATVD